MQEQIDQVLRQRRNQPILIPKREILRYLFAPRDNFTKHLVQKYFLMIRAREA